MTIGRALDPALAYSLLRNGVAGKLLQSIGLKRIITLPLVTRVGMNTDFFGAGLLDKPGNMLLAMSAVTSLRHVGHDYVRSITSEGSFYLLLYVLTDLVGQRRVSL
jgi:hypothetical protein